MSISAVSDFELEALEGLMNTLIAETGKKAEDLSPKEIIDYILEHRTITNAYDVLALSQKRFGDFRLLTPENLEHMFAKSFGRSGRTGAPHKSLYDSGKKVLLDSELGLKAFMGEEKFEQAIRVMVHVFDLVNELRFHGNACDEDIQQLSSMLKNRSVRHFEGERLG